MWHFNSQYLVNILTVVTIIKKKDDVTSRSRFKVSLLVPKGKFVVQTGYSNPKLITNTTLVEQTRTSHIIEISGRSKEFGLEPGIQ